MDILYTVVTLVPSALVILFGSLFVAQCSVFLLDYISDYWYPRAHFYRCLYAPGSCESIQISENETLIQGTVETPESNSPQDIKTEEITILKKTPHVFVIQRRVNRSEMADLYERSAHEYPKSESCAACEREENICFRCFKELLLFGQ